MPVRTNVKTIIDSVILCDTHFPSDYHVELRRVDNNEIHVYYPYGNFNEEPTPKFPVTKNELQKYINALQEFHDSLNG